MTSSADALPRLDIHRTDDFPLTGQGDHATWRAAPAVPLKAVRNTGYRTDFKALWSPTGLYFLVDCVDQRLTCTGLPDMADLWNEDVVEIFIQPDPALPLYLEYEISPTGSELVLMVPNLGGRFLGWLPFHYEGARRVRRATAVRGGPATPGASVSGWTAEVFIPAALMSPLWTGELRSGLEWRVNVCRIDYDAEPTHFTFGDLGCRFHNYREFPVFHLV